MPKKEHASRWYRVWEKEIVFAIFRPFILKHLKEGVVSRGDLLERLRKDNIAVCASTLNVWLTILGLDHVFEVKTKYRFVPESPERTPSLSTAELPNSPSQAEDVAIDDFESDPIHPTAPVVGGGITPAVAGDDRPRIVIDYGASR